MEKVENVNTRVKARTEILIKNVKKIFNVDGRQLHRDPPIILAIITLAVASS